MALLDLEPKISVCITNNCTTLTVYDTTQPESIDNAFGWGASTLNPVSISNAELHILTPSNTLLVFNITSVLNAQTTVTGSFLLGNFIVPAEDGQYKITYILQTVDRGLVTKNIELCIFSLCVVRCCVDSLWKQVAINALSEDCNCTHEKTSALEKAEIAEGLFNAIKFGVACGSTDIKNELLRKLQKICKLEKCNCN